MVAPPKSKPAMNVVVIQATGNGLHIVSIPDGIGACELDKALHELGINAERVYEIRDWKRTADGVAAAFVPLPASN
jgi:hypothetical protein